MAQFGWANAPQDALNQIETLVAGLRTLLPGNLVGVYLHGSLAMGCFNPQRSDLDLLAVTAQSVDANTKRNLAELLLGLSGHPYPIETSLLTQADLLPWQFPTPYDFHYSEDWRGRMSGALATGSWAEWSGPSHTDPDLAAHITVLQTRGVAIWGAPIAKVFPEVPSSDYLAAIWDHDTKGAARNIAGNPVYYILNLCRILFYLAEGQVASKEEGGRWAAGALPEAYSGLVSQALLLYQGDKSEERFRPDDLQKFAAYMEERIEAEIS